jgi:DNA-binding PadR family transcriptional regulator
VFPVPLYRAISRLLDAAFLHEIDRAGGADERRRVYSLTPAGRRAAAVEAGRLARQVETARARKLLKSRA